jgi:ketosteroid isomerase-like protein
MACAAALLAFAAGCATMSAIRRAVDAAGEIRAVRERSNAAIARHDLAALRETWVEDVQITSGLGSAANGSREVEERIAAAFADPTFDRWVRTPETFELAADGDRAAEIGTWMGRWNKADGTMVRRGRYLAHWVLLPQGWRIRAELFVALSCEGSAECGAG